MAKYRESSNNHRRDATYDDKKVVCCPNASTLGSCKFEAAAGDIVEYQYKLLDGGTLQAFGRMIAAVSAPFVPSSSDPKYDAPEVKNHLAVIEFAWGGFTGRIRWIDPADVTAIRTCPKEFPAWFFQDALPPVEDILAADRHGSLMEPYIARWTREAPEREAYRAEQKKGSMR